MKKIKHLFLLAALMITGLAAAQTAYAQDGEELRLRLNRDFGYSAIGGGQIQGTFSMIASGPDNLSRVVFYMDDQVLGEITEQPFSLRFVTDNYPLGEHAISATGYTEDGREMRSNIIRTEFVSAGQGMGTAVYILGAIFGVIAVGMGIAFLFGNVLGKGKRTDLPLGASRNYGVFGGAICPNCSRPFALHVYGLKLLVARFDRCPYCGRWSFVRRAGMDELKLAEAVELQSASPVQQVASQSTEEKLLKDLEDSRYQDR